MLDRRGALRFGAEDTEQFQDRHALLKLEFVEFDGALASVSEPQATVSLADTMNQGEGGFQSAAGLYTGGTDTKPCKTGIAFMREDDFHSELVGLKNIFEPSKLLTCWWPMQTPKLPPKL